MPRGQSFCWGSAGTEAQLLLLAGSMVGEHAGIEQDSRSCEGSNRLALHMASSSQLSVYRDGKLPTLAVATADAEDDAEPEPDPASHLPSELNHAIMLCLALDMLRRVWYLTKLASLPLSLQTLAQAAVRLAC